MIVYIDPDQHGMRGTSLPFWLRFEGKMSTTMEQRIKAQLTELLGVGSTMPAPDRQWAHQFREGWLTLMFKTREDRTLAHFAIDV